MLVPGTTVAGYRIEGVLGRGGMGVVYEATDISLNRTVALKLVSTDVGDDVVFRERFQREGQIQAAIDHPHIVPVYGAGESEHGLFLAMRLVRGPNLKDMVVSRELDAGRALRILTPIADALDVAHAAGLIHRDIKPQNVLVGGRDHAFLADFGLTKAAGEKSLTKTGQFVGTLDYISPEQIRGERATTRSDVYALAAVLYECLTGVVPYPKESEAAVLYAHMADPVPRPTDHRPDLPAGLDAVLGKAMAKDPAGRHALASDLLRDAESVFGRRVRAAFSPPAPIEAPEETGIRQAEAVTPTREARAREAENAPEPATQPAPTSASDPTAPPVPTTAFAPAPAPATAVSHSVTRPAAQADAAHGGAAAASPATPPVPAGVAARPFQPAGGSPTQTLSRPRAPTAAAVTLVVAVAVVGLLLGRSTAGSGESVGAGENPAAAGSLRLDLPAGWKLAGSRPTLPGARFADPIAAAPAGGGEGVLIAGQVAATGPALLPAAFVARLDGPPERDDPVALGQLEAYRYRDLNVAGLDGPATIYAAPTTGGVATVACVAGEAAAAAFMRACEGAAGSLELTEGEPFALGPAARYARTLDGAMSTLGDARRAGLERLRAGRTPRAQARAADGLAGAYGTARATVRRARVSPADQGANAAIASALARTARAYQGLALAARSGRQGAYDAARGGVARAENRVRRALAALKEHGYQIG